MLLCAEGLEEGRRQSLEEREMIMAAEVGKADTP